MGTLLRSNVADQTAFWPFTVTGTKAHCTGDVVTLSNQNWCSLIISASRTLAPTGGVTVKLTVALAPGATSAGSGFARLLSQVPDVAEPPEAVAKWMSRSTSLAPVEGHVMLPVLVALTEKVWLTPCVHFVGTPVISKLADHTPHVNGPTENDHVYGVPLTVSDTVYFTPDCSGACGTTTTPPRLRRELPSAPLFESITQCASGTPLPVNECAPAVVDTLPPTST